MIIVIERPFATVHFGKMVSLLLVVLVQLVAGVGHLGRSLNREVGARLVGAMTFSFSVLYAAGTVELSDYITLVYLRIPRSDSIIKLL